MANSVAPISTSSGEFADPVNRLISAEDRPRIQQLVSRVAKHAGVQVVRCASCGLVKEIRISDNPGTSEGLCGSVECLVAWGMSRVVAEAYAARLAKTVAA